MFYELVAAMIDGVPNLLNVELPSEKMASLLSTDNLPTVVNNPELVDKAILKEERNHLAYFTLNLGIIKLVIMDKKNKKPRIYRHGGYISYSSTNPINQLVDCELSEPAIGYAKVLEHHAAYLWRLEATYPGCTVDSDDNNVNGAFL